jgi:hypothetical protein
MIEPSFFSQRVWIESYSNRQFNEFKSDNSTLFQLMIINGFNTVIFNNRKLNQNCIESRFIECKTH